MEKTTEQVTKDLIHEFAKLNLEIATYMRENKDYDVDLLRELKESAQALAAIVL